MTTVFPGSEAGEAVRDFSWCFSSLFDKFRKTCRTCGYLSSFISTRSVNGGFPPFSSILGVQGSRGCSQGLFLEWTSSRSSLSELLFGSSLLLQVGLLARLLWRSF